MSDFERRQPRATRGASKRGRRRLLKSKGRAQTTRSEEDQQEHRQQYKQVHLQRQRELEAAAKARAIELANQMQGPITGIGPFNTFTLVQLLTMEFSGALDAILSPETLERDHSSINASARQKFAAAIKADKAFASVQALRLPTEPAITDFVSLFFRVKAAGEAVTELLDANKHLERARHPHCAAVKELPPDATLMTIVRTAALATKPRRGRPTKRVHGGDDESDDELTTARNWADGGYTVDSMYKRARFDSWRITVAQTSTQRDVLEGTELIINGAPTSVEELRMFKPSKRKVQISHATTARLHAMQLHEWHCRQAGQRVSYPFPQWDEGTAGNFSTGVPAVVAGVRGLACFRLPRAT